MRKHKAVLNGREQSTLFDYQLKESPYYDPDWGHLNHGKLNRDKDLIVSVATGGTAV